MTTREAIAALGDVLRGVQGLRVYEYPPDTFAPPGAVLGLPSYDMQELPGPCWALVRVPVTVAVARSQDRQASTDLTDYVDDVIDAVRSLDTLPARVLRAAPTTVGAADQQLPAYQIDVELVVT